MAFVAALRRAAGGAGYKTAKQVGSPLFLPDTCASNVGTYIARWPKHLTEFICYGTSVRTQRTLASRAVAMPRRGYLAVTQEETAPLHDKLNGRDRPLEANGVTPTQTEHPCQKPRAPAPDGRAEQNCKFGLHQLALKHASLDPISMVTAYDYPSARLADAAGIDMVLVGDSLGMVVLGQPDTTSVTMEQMVHHTRAAARGVRRSMVVADLPFGSYLTPADAAANGVRLLKEGKADAVKLEGGKRACAQVRALADAGVAVMGHIGLCPQSHAAHGGYRVQGRTADAAQDLLDDALALQASGAFAIVLEMVPGPVAQRITEALNVPTIGIGAGAATSGQVQVFHDLLGLYDGKMPRFAKRFAALGGVEGPIAQALRDYGAHVSARAFPAAEHTFKMRGAELDELDRRLSANKAANSPSDVPKPLKVNGHRAAKLTAAPAMAPAATLVAPARSMRVVTSIAEWRALQADGTLPSRFSLGLVPTMGALHAGHLSLVSRALEQNDHVAASVFVNPKQFAAGDDPDTYPRDLDSDLAALESAGAHAVFAPSADEMYPADGAAMSPFVDLDGADEIGEGAARPGFFRGVATVVAKLLNIVQPQRVYFGAKDGMQCVVVRRMVDALNFPTEVVVGPTVRESDGLAMSSRNAYLSSNDRQAAPAVYAALTALRGAWESGERSTAALRHVAAEVIAKEPRLSLEYVSLSDVADGAELGEFVGEKGPNAEPAGRALASIAVRLGGTRLIDNVVL